MTAVLVTQVERVVLWHKAQFEHARLKMLMLSPGPAQAAVSLKLFSQHAQRNTGLASVAVGAVSEHAAAPETLSHQFGVSLVVNQMAGRRNLRAGLPRGQVAARVGSSGVELQALQWQVFEMRHVWGLRICCQ